MQAKLKRNISLLLLAIIAFATMPAPLLHDLLADHTDAAENHCRYYHKDLGCHVEEQQEHCHVFKTQTPLYDAVKVAPELKLFENKAPAYIIASLNAVPFSAPLGLPARGPPAC